MITTLRELAEYVQRREGELAPGSETSNLSAFVAEYGYLSEILDGDAADRPVSADVAAEWVEAYDALEEE